VVVVCCVAVGCATVVVSCVVVVVVVAGSDAHEANPSSPATPSRRISVFIVKFPFVENSAQMPQTDVFLANFSALCYWNFPSQLARGVNSIDHFHQLESLFRVVDRRCLTANGLGKIAQLHFETVFAVSRFQRHGR
jgi:hypothetical protein